MSHALKLAHFISISKNAFLFPFAGKLISRRKSCSFFTSMTRQSPPDRPNGIDSKSVFQDTLFPLFSLFSLSSCSIFRPSSRRCNITVTKQKIRPHLGEGKEEGGLHPFLLLFLSRDISKFNLKLTGGGRENSNREATTTSTWVNFGGRRRKRDRRFGERASTLRAKVTMFAMAHLLRRDKGWAPLLLG